LPKLSTNLRSKTVQKNPRRRGLSRAESDEDKPGVILDYDASGNLVSLEILDASRRVTQPTGIEYQVAPTMTP
jgi:uncharacterized protein YuzE